MQRVIRPRSCLAVALVAVLTVAADSAQAGITQTAGFSFLFGDATLERNDANGNGPPGTQAYNFFKSSSNFAVTPTLTQASSGSIFDTATGTVTVASASLDGNITGTNTLSGSQFVRFDASSTFRQTLTTNTLANYQPPGTPTNSTATFQGSANYNVGLAFVVSTPIDYELSITRASVVGSAVTTANIVFEPDTDGDGVGDGSGSYVVILPTQIVFAAPNTLTVLGTLAPAQGFYRVSYTGSVSGTITSDNATANSSADFTASFAVVPEPAAAMWMFPAVVLLTRRRRDESPLRRPVLT